MALSNHWRPGDERAVLTVTQIAAFVGVGLAGAAYVPQIWHLARVHCSAGISRFAFYGWLGASLLVTTHAIATRAVVFILLGGVQILAITVILVYATKYASSYCASHAPRDLDLGTETKSRIVGDEVPSSAPTLRRWKDLSDGDPSEWTGSTESHMSQYRCNSPAERPARA